MRSLKSALFLAGLMFAVAASAAPLRDGYPPAISGLVYKDAATSILIYVETDGRHVVAFTPDGKILWTQGPASLWMSGDSEL